jgi:glycosyltransferase involved in cell wall biosynthesis
LQTVKFFTKQIVHVVESIHTLINSDRNRPIAKSDSEVVAPRVPSISVIIPAYNASKELELALGALAASTMRPFELLVVNDGSTDGTLEVAASLGARVLNTGAKSGPARARNLGAEEAKGDILFFLDADVCVHTDTLALVCDAFLQTGTDAVIGSYDDQPTSPDFLSQYKNLMHCFVHQNGRATASTFWSGCGAIRREVFLKNSGFDEGYARPAIEDIELGYRLVQGGGTIVLDHQVRVKHLKRWTFWGLVKTDILDRGIPWTELILRDQCLPNDLNVQLSQRVSLALVYLMLGLAAACAIYWKGYFLTPLFALLFFMLGRYFVDGRGTQPLRVSIVLAACAGAIGWLSWLHHMYGLIPLVVLSVPALLLRHRYQLQENKGGFWRWLLFALYMAGSIGSTLVYLSLPGRPLMMALTATLVVILILNRQFYVFLAGKRGGWFALAAIPFHLLYHFYNGISFTVGLCRWAWKSIFRSNSYQAAPDHGE